MHTTLTTEYWVIDETGLLADPDRTARLPGSTAVSSPYRVAIETPPCETCGELQTELDDRLETTVAAAHAHGCRLVALGLRPDLLANTAHTDLRTLQPPAVTAGTQISFSTTPADAVDHYNCLLALDPAFALLNTTSRVDGETEYACGRPSFYHRDRQPVSYRTNPVSESTATTEPDSGTDLSDWQPVRILDGGSTVQWRSLDATTPTVLIDLIADIKTVLQTASQCRVEIESYGIGHRVDRLVLPSEKWRAIYTSEAIQKGLSSLLVRAYLERLGLDTDWYLAATPPTVGVCQPANRPAVCTQRAEQLEAELGIPLRS